MPASGQGLHPSDSIRAQAKNLAQVFTAKDAKVAKKEGENASIREGMPQLCTALLLVSSFGGLGAITGTRKGHK